MSILINGMNMPSKGEYRLVLYCHSDGTATLEGVSTEFEGEPFEVVEVPTPHGKLIDADALVQSIDTDICITGYENLIAVADALQDIFDTIQDAPAVIEPEK